MKQDGYQVTSDIIAKTEPDSANTMRLTSDMPRMEPVANKDMTKLNTKVRTPDNKVEVVKDVSKAIEGK